MPDENENDEIMTVAQVAKYLHLAERTVLRMAQRGEIPAAKVASQWRFIRPVVREWVLERMQALPTTVSSAAESRGAGLLPMVEVLRPELMTFDLQPGPKESLLRQMLAPLLKAGFARDADRLLKGLLERERMMTTAIGHGIAVPHPREPIRGMFSEPAIALGICPAGTDFQAIDDQSVHLFFLICATRVEIHLRLLAEVSRFARMDAAQELRQVATAEEVKAIVRATVPP